ncbi:MAG: VWA domain-containing protein [Anaerolineae bacterium]
MTLTTPLALVLLIALPLVIYIGWPRNRFRRVRDIGSLLLRVLIITLLVFALAGVQIVQSADRLAVVFLVDVSDSMGAAAQDAAFAYIQTALDDMQPDDLAGVVTFAADAQVARSMSTARELGPIRAGLQTGNTDLAAAIRLGLAMFPGDAARRMVILSDGQPTLGDAESAAQLATAAGVEISYVPYAPPQTPEVQVQDFNVPAVVDENQEFDMTVTIASEQDTESRVTILAGGEIVSRQEVLLRQGVNNYTLRLQSGAAGFRDFQVQVEPLGADGFYQNNALGAFSRVEGASRVLVVGEETAEETRYIVPALQEAGLEVDVTTPNGLPIGVGGLTAYDSVVLVNVSALNLSNSRMSALESYVSDLGGGLVVIGGPEAYGPGGYFQTPLEDALPVEVQIRDQERLPQLTIAYVIDRSGSMGAVGLSGIPNIDLAKEAIIRSIDFLQPTDRAGVASFDTEAFWVAELQDVFDRRELQRRVASLTPSGGTDIVAGLSLVARDIVNEPAELKHIILLTDGGAQPGNLVQLAEDLQQQDNVSTSVISIGEFEAQFLQEMARVGEGNYHNVADAESIPQIFAQETVLATRTYIQEDPFTPVLTANHPIMQSITALPQLRGYVATTPRAAAQTILRGPEPYSDPVLVAWQYGLGRSVAFTSDATARWGQNWVSWGDFATFWSQAVRWTITEGTSENLETRVVMEDEQARITVDARDNDGNFLNGQGLQASVVYTGDQSSQRVPLRQVAPGRYEAVFTPEGEGAYFLRVTGTSADESADVQLNQTTGWVMSYSPEYEVREFDDTLLASIAALTEGQNLAETPDAVFAHNLTARDAFVPVWPWLLLAAMLLLPFDIAVRRLMVTRSDLRRLSAWAFGRRSRPVEEQVAERMTSLKEARNRARESIGQPNTEDAPAPARTVSALRSRTAEAREAAQATTQKPASPTASRPEASASDSPRRPAPPVPPQTKEDAASSENIGARLLKKRRQDDEQT